MFFFVATCSAEIAQKINKDSYALVFGINTFIALVFQTILTLVATDQSGFALNERNQYAVYGYCYFGISVLFCLFGVWTVYDKQDLEESDQFGPKDDFIQMDEVIKTEGSTLLKK